MKKKIKNKKIMVIASHNSGKIKEMAFFLKKLIKLTEGKTCPPVPPLQKRIFFFINYLDLMEFFLSNLKSNRRLLRFL